MRNILTLFFFIFCFNSWASNWMPVSKIEAMSNQAYQLKETCEKISGEECLDIGEEPEAVSLGFSSIESTYSKTQVQSCEDESDCQAKHEGNVCIEGESIKNLDLMEVYCSALISKQVVKDQINFDSYKAAKHQEKLLDLALEGAKKLRECGLKVMDLLLVRNSQKVPALTTTQVKQIVSVFAPIKGLLETGSLNSAKEEVQLVQPDGVLITNEDKASIILAIDSCLGV